MYHLKKEIFPALVQSYAQKKPEKTLEISPNDKFAYWASQAAYGNDTFTQKLFNEGYTKRESNPEYLIFSHPSKPGLIAFRGTKTPKDFYSDLQIAYNFPVDSRFRKARQLAEKYPNYILTGHSLGGSLAIDASKKEGNPAIVFNPGSSIYGLDYGGAKVYKSTNDIISDRLRGLNPIYETKGDHSLSSFEFLNDSPDGT